MNIYICLPNTGDLKKFLQQRDIKYDKKRNNLLIPVSNRRGNLYLCPTELIPSINKVETKLMIEAFECGGRKNKESSLGTATIVCGCSGKKLKPFTITPEPKKTDCHGSFLTPNSIATLRFDKTINSLVITKHVIEKSIDSDYFWIKSINIYRGDGQGLPENFYNFRSAFAALKNKTRCINCTHLHFAQKL